MDKTNSLYEDCKALGIPTHNHESDLYIPATPQTRELIKKHGIQTAKTFTNRVEGGTWFDCPFQFDPFWAAKAGKA